MSVPILRTLTDLGIICQFKFFQSDGQKIFSGYITHFLDCLGGWTPLHTFIGTCVSLGHFLIGWFFFLLYIMRVNLCSLLPVAEPAMAVLALWVLGSSYRAFHSQIFKNKSILYFILIDWLFGFLKMYSALFYLEFLFCLFTFHCGKSQVYTHI